MVGCRLVVEPRTRISRGFAFVTMDTNEDAERCVKYLNQSVLEGRYITVEKVIFCTMAASIIACRTFYLILSLTWRFLAIFRRHCVRYVGSNQDDQFIHFNFSHTA